MGLLVRIFRRDLSLRVEEGRVGARAGGCEVLLLVLVVEVVANVKDSGEGEGLGVVTSQMIVFKIARVGGSE